MRNRLYCIYCKAHDKSRQELKETMKARGENWELTGQRVPGEINEQSRPQGPVWLLAGAGPWC